MNYGKNARHPPHTYYYLGALPFVTAPNPPPFHALRPCSIHVRSTGWF